LDAILARGDSHPRESIAFGKDLMQGLRSLADQYSIPLRPQGPGLVFHATMLKPGAGEGTVRSYRDYVRRHDAARWAHLRRCLLENGVRAIERGLWFLSLEHTESDVREALIRAEPAFERHAFEWKVVSQ
jgi:glutamate-1-semialdehyde 2,1-aminomutase